MTRKRQKPRYEITIQVFDDDAPELEASAAVLGITPENFLAYAPNFMMLYCDSMPDFMKAVFAVVQALYPQEIPKQTQRGNKTL